MRATSFLSRTALGASALISALLSLGCAVPARAAVKTWDGGGTDNYWQTAANWVGNTAPAAGDSLFFTGTLRLTTTNNYPAGTVFNGITFASPAGAFTLHGNAITLGGDIINAEPSAVATILLAMAINANRTVTVANASGALVIGGAISGAGGLAKAGPGSLILAGANGYSGPTTVNAGTLFVNGALAPASAVTVAFGGTLGGVGAIGGSAAIQAGGTLRPGMNAIGTLTVNGNLSLGGLTVMEVSPGVVPNCDLVTGIATLTYGGSLQVVNQGVTPRMGDCYTLFSANTYSGAFASITPPPQNPGLGLNTSTISLNGQLCSIQAACASSKTVECGFAWAFDDPTAAGMCLDTNLTLTVLSTVTNVPSCPLVVTRTWQVSDNCGNVSLCSQTVTVADTHPPNVVCAPDKTVPCGTSWTFDPPTATDLCCGANVTITVISTTASTRIWQITDCCGNSVACSQTVTVSQSSPPRIVSLYVPCGGTKVTIGFDQPVTAASARDPFNYQVSCGGVVASIVQATLTGPQTVCLTLGQPVGGACSITVANIQNLCGSVLPTTTLPAQCSPAPCGSSGIEYWLTFPGNHGPDPADSPQPQLLIAGPAGAVGSVDIPGLLPPFSANFTIPASGGLTVLLPTDADLGDANDVVEAKGVHVTASQAVTVYGLNDVRFSADSFLGLATTSLGKAYRVLAYRNMFPDTPELTGSQLAVVGTVNGTTVTIVPPVDVGSHAAGVPFTIPLMAGDTYQLRQTNTVPDDLTGTLVLADQPVAVFGSHLCANLPDTNTFFCDHLVEQLSPTDTWGTNFVTVKLATRKQSDTFRCLALLTNTVVRTNGVALPGLLHQGQFAEFQLATNAHISADKPILVAQYANSSDFDLVQFSDPFMTLIPPTSLYGNSYDIHVPANFPASYLNVTVPAGGTNGILLDSSPIPGNSFSAIGTSGYFGARVSVPPGPHTLSSSLSLFGAIVYGWGEYVSYGHPAGLCSASTAPPPVNFTCPPSSIVLQAGANCTVAVPDLTSQVGNAAAALLITQSPAAGTLVGPGNYNITIPIVDQYGQRHLCATALTVLQSGPAGLQCPFNMVTNCASGAGRSVTFQASVCNTNFSISCNPSSGSLFPPGVTTVTCTANGPGSTQQCAFTVTVNCVLLTIIRTPPAGTNQTILWPGNGRLYKATNVQGPYLPLLGATSPYTNRTDSQGFFRVGP